MELITVPGPKDAHEIINRWGLFNWGKSSADHLDDLYPLMLRMPITVRAGGGGGGAGPRVYYLGPYWYY